MGFSGVGFASKGTKTVVNITAFKVLMSTIAKKARSKAELRELTGLSNTTISRWMTVLSSGKDRIVYIESWSRKNTRGCYTAMWRMGWGMPDAPKPAPLTASEYAKRWRARKEKEATLTVQRTSTGLIHTNHLTTTGTKRNA
jgi:hypothetical protein